MPRSSSTRRELSLVLLLERARLRRQRRAELGRGGQPWRRSQLELDCRECHIRGDLLLVYRKPDDATLQRWAILVASGRRPTAVFRIAHISDLHVLSPRGVEWRRILFNKRITGYANLLAHRARVYRREYLVAVLSAAAAEADHVVVTGDVTNLSLEREFEEARALLDGLARTVEVTVVPGNHDVYLPSVHAARRFQHHFGAFLRSDLPKLALDMETGPFPCVKLRGPAAIIALSTAVPRPPFIASGRVGAAQLAALEQVLAHPEVNRRTPVVLVHHPPVDERMRLRVLRDGLVDAGRLRAALAPLARGLVLFGHLHARVRRPLPTAAGDLVAISASGAALDHQDPAVRAGLNAYAIDGDGRLVSADAHVLAPDGRTLVRAPLLEHGRVRS